MKSWRKKEYKEKKCRYCKSKENLTLDHKVPIVQGGKDDVSNFQTLCMRCNGTKSGLSHNQVMNYFRWFLAIQEGRKANKAKPYEL